MNFNRYISSGILMCQLLHLIWWHSWMPAGKVQTMNMESQHLIHRHGTIFPLQTYKKTPLNIKKNSNLYTVIAQTYSNGQGR